MSQTEYSILGVGDYGALNTVGKGLKTLALGSCVAVVLYHPPTRTVGMAHVALPDSKINPQKGKDLPGYFADTGLDALYTSMRKYTAQASPKAYVTKLVGGASVIAGHQLFNIGKRNIETIGNILSKAGVTPLAQDVGGAISRTVSIDVLDGKVTIASPGRGLWKL